MNTTRSTILAGIDGSSLSSAVTDYTAWIARCIDAPVKLLHNIEHSQPSDMNLSGNLGPGESEELLAELTELESRRSKILRDQGKLMLESASRQLLEAGTENVSQLQRHGNLIDTLIEMEEEIRILVMGVRGEANESRETAIGNQLEPVIRAMHRPVLVVNRPFDKPPEQLMIAYDGSEAAQKGLDMVSMSPLYRELTCHLVQVGKNSSTDQSILQEGKAILEQAGLSVIGANLTGETEKALLAYQQEHNIDLIVMGAFGHSRLREILFGSITLKMLAQAKTPLLLLR